MSARETRKKQRKPEDPWVHEANGAEPRLLPRTVEAEHALEDVHCRGQQEPLPEIGVIPVMAMHQDGHVKRWEAKDVRVPENFKLRALDLDMGLCVWHAAHIVDSAKISEADLLPSFSSEIIF